MGILDSLFGKPKESNKDAENAARAKALREAGIASDQFIAGGAPVYDQGQQYTFNELGQLEQLGPSEMQNIQTDPRLMQAQYDALRELETRGRDGFTARDELDRLKTKQQVGKENAGRLGAIQQNMAARGMGGSGLDLVAQLQASQAATEREALAGLERNAAQEANRSNASAQAGGLAGNIRGQGFQENSAKAQAQDAINRFNTTNSVNRSMYNNRGINDVNAQNVSRRNQTMDRNTEGQYGFRKDALGVKQGQQQMNYNSATEDLNAKRIRDQQKQAQYQAKIGAIGTLAGAGAAGFASGGNPQAMQAGGQIGGAASGLFYAMGGKVPEGKDCYASGGYVDAPEVVPWDSMANDIKQINVSGGEIVIPKSIANDPLASAQFVDQENRKAMGQARDRQDYMGLGNVLGKAATDYGNSRNPDVILANRMQDLGKAPAMVGSEKKQFDSSVLDNIGRQGVSRASEDAMRNEKAFGRDMQMRQMATLNDPSSPESIAAREYLKRVAPQLAGTPGFERLTADKVSKIAPNYQNMYEMDQRAADKRADAAQKQSQFNQTLGMRQDENEYKQALLGQNKEERAQKNRELSATDNKYLTQLQSGSRAVDEMTRALDSGTNTFSIFGDNDFTRNARLASEMYGRLQSGGAINKDEEERFMKMLPGPTDSKEQQQKKLQDAREYYRQAQENFQRGRPDLGASQASPQSGKSIGSTGSWENY